MIISKEPGDICWSTIQSSASCVRIRQTRLSFGIPSLISTSLLPPTSLSTSFIFKFRLATGFSGCTTSLAGATWRISCGGGAFETQTTYSIWKILKTLGPLWITFSIKLKKQRTNTQSRVWNLRQTRWRITTSILRIRCILTSQGITSCSER